MSSSSWTCFFFHLLLLLSLLHSLRFFGLSVIVVSSVTVRARGTSVLRRCNWFRELVCRLIGICYSLLLLVCGFVVADALNRRLCSWYLLLSLSFLSFSLPLSFSLSPSLPDCLFTYPYFFHPSIFLSLTLSSFPIIFLLPSSLPPSSSVISLCHSSFCPSSSPPPSLLAGTPG